MRYSERSRLLGMTWVGWLNVLVAQWFGLRLTTKLDERGEIAGTGTVLWRPLAGWAWRWKILSIAWIAGLGLLLLWRLCS